MAAAASRARQWRNGVGSFTMTAAAKRGDGAVMAVQRSLVRRLAPCAALVAASLATLPAPADEIVVMTSGAFTAPFQDAAPWFERRTGHDVTGVFGASMGGAPDSIPARLARGERADVVIVSAQALDALIAAGEIEPGTRRDLVL
jgi:molybdate transport system substrate-binding protein